MTDKKKSNAGRPTKYKPEYAEQAGKLCGILGATDEKLAQFFGVCELTIRRWKKDHQEFCSAIKSKEQADSEVEKSLYQTALSGNTTAQIFWLKNRKPKEWRDKQEIDHTTKGESIKSISPHQFVSGNED